jgi:O-acetyl-ADP-ribose deacetylase (regulator of RNase III)
MNINHSTIQIIQADITSADVDVIVNAANTFLIPGGGVDGAIHRAAGPQLYEELKQYRSLATGHALLTIGYLLPSPYIIHAVGPIWDEFDIKEHAKDALVQTYRSIFALVDKHHFNHIAIPNISTGVYGFPKPLAASLVIQTTLEWMQKTSFKGVISFYCFDEENDQLYKQAVSFNEEEVK